MVAQTRTVIPAILLGLLSWFIPLSSHSLHFH